MTAVTAAAAVAAARAGMRRYLRVVGLCLACGFCSLLYAFSQLAVSLEEGAAGGRRPQAAVVSWLADGGRGTGRGAGSAGPGRTGRYEPHCREWRSGRAGRAAPSPSTGWLASDSVLDQLEIESLCNFLKGSLEVSGVPQNPNYTAASGIPSCFHGVEAELFENQAGALVEPSTSQVSKFSA